MQLPSYAPQVAGPSSGTPLFGSTGGLAQITGPLAGRPAFPLNVFPASTFGEPAPMDLDKGQLSCSWEFMTVKGASAGAMAPGIEKEHLFFVQTPTDAPFIKRVTCTAKSLTDLNKLLFTDAWEARTNQRHRPLYHAPEPHDRTMHTCAAIRRDWALMGVCTATEGADSTDRALMDKVTISARIGGHTQCFNYWAVRESDARLYLLLKLVRVMMDSTGNPMAGCFADMSYAAEWARQRGGAALIEDEVDDVKRRRMESAARAGRLNDPFMAWQLTPYIDRTGEGPPVSEFSGEFIDINAADAEDQTVRWFGDAIYVGRSLFVGAQGSSGARSRAQIEAALAFTHTFESSSKDTSISTLAPLAAVIGTTEVAIGM